jgi:hypothetical protein
MTTFQGRPEAQMWRDLVIDSLVRPRAAARRVLDAGVPDVLLLQAAIMVACLWIVLQYILVRSVPEIAAAFPEAGLGNPILGAVLQVAETLVIAFLAARIGRLFGGGGAFQGALAVVVWWKAISAAALAAIVLLVLTVPILGALVALVAACWTVWAFVNFIAELHGFQNPFVVLGVSLLAAFVLWLASGMLFAIVGSILQETT